MSSKIMGAVWDLDLPHHKQSILLAMADHADHLGNNVFPSVGLVAWKTGYSPRQTVRIVHELVKDGLLVLVNERKGTSKHYRIDLSKGKPKEPYKPTPLKMRDPLSQNDRSTPDKMSDHPCHSYVIPTSDIAMSEDPSYKPSLNQESQATQKTLPGLPPETPPEVQHKEKKRNPIWDAIAEEITHSLAPEGNSGLTATILYGKRRPKIPGFLECYFGNKIQPDTETAERIGILIRRAVKFTVGVQGLSAPGTGEKLCRLVRDYMKSDQYKDAVEMGEITT